MVKYSGELLKTYGDRFFQWETCPHALRIRSEGRVINKSHVKQQRLFWDRFIATSTIAQKPVSEINRGDVIDFRQNLMVEIPEKYNTINKVVGALKVILSEAEYREDIPYNPASRVGAIKYKKKDVKILSIEETKVYVRQVTPMLQFTALTGMRIGEVSVLHHDQIDGRVLTIDRARAGWNADPELKLPKWDKVRTIIIPECITIPEGDGLVFGRTVAYPSVRHHHLKAKSGTTVHGLRHSLHTNLLSAGVNPALLMAWFGWSPEMGKMQVNYYHPTVDQLREVSRAIDSLYGDAASTVSVYRSKQDQSVAV